MAPAIFGEFDPVAWNAESLAHGAAVGAVLAEAVLHVSSAIFWYEAEDMAHLVEHFGDDALSALVGGEILEASGRDDCPDTLDSTPDNEVVISLARPEVVLDYHQIVVWGLGLPGFLVQVAYDSAGP
jgi:hypothetical protein